MYQYHLEFCNLPKSVQLLTKGHPPLADLMLQSNGQWLPRTREAIYGAGVKPFKSLTFRHRIQASRSIPGPPKFKDFIWVCDDLIGGYSGSNPDEDAIIHAKYPNGSMPWTDESAQMQEFCGAISLSGDVVYRLPMKQRLPNTVFKIIRMNQAGTSVLIRVGEVLQREESGEDQYDIPGTVDQYPGNFRETLIYTYPDSLEQFDDAKDAVPLKQAMKLNGL